MPGTLRHADPDRDAAACAAIYEPFVVDCAASFEEVAPSPAEFSRRIAETSRHHPWLVLQKDDRVVGFAFASPHHERAAYRWAATVGVYVDPAHHGAGAGRQLYGALLDLLRRQGLWVAVAAITLPNDASVGLHRAFGFEEVGVYRDIGWKAGAWRDVSWWRLSLRDAHPAAPPAEPLGPQRLPGDPG
ncbi:MAG TPA: GNAT family N-acetyltransferase [Solirubrobacteraceae bacterium]